MGMDSCVLEIVIAVVLGFVISAAIGVRLIPFLRRMKYGQTIKEDGPTWHMAKQGTPAMGGLMFIAAAAIVTICMDLQPACRNLTCVLVLLFAGVFGAIGFLDDYAKVKKKENTGLTAKQKFLLQLAAAVVFLILLRAVGVLDAALYIPFADVTIRLPWPVYIVLSLFIITGTVNSVNLTDGVDGLAAGVTVPVCAFYAAAFGYAYGMHASPNALGMAILAAALLGALLGFLVHNFHPAKVFMGDTGSLFLGGAVCGMAYALNMPLILLPVGIIYIVETLSVILQVTYFKLTHGKRIFRMSPLHHHFEMCGWSEEKLFFVFSGITLVFCVIAFVGVAGGSFL